MDIKLAIVGATIIDGTGSEPFGPATVLIGADGRIAAVGGQGEVEVPLGATVINAAQRMLLPGLIDAHQHLAWDKTLYSPRALGQTVAPLKDRERQLVRAAYFAQLALTAGVTTVRDCGADDFAILALRDMINRGAFQGPRILASGRPITTTAGHLYTDWGVDGEVEIRKAVRLLASKGVDFIKLMLSGGTTSPGTNITRAQYSRDELQVAVDEAHRLGLQLAVHAISTDSIRLAAETGVDTIEHCSWIGSAPHTTCPDREAVNLMLKNGVRVDHAIVPRPYLFADECGHAMSAEDRWWFEMLKVRWSFLQEMRERGVAVFLGSDSAYGPWPGTDFWPGFQDFARAIEIMVRWGGFRPLDALRMATAEAAAALHLEHEIGTIAPGRRGDLLLLQGDPLADIRTLRKVEMVLRDGNVVASQGQIVLHPQIAGAVELRGWELPV